LNDLIERQTGRTNVYYRYETVSRNFKQINKTNLKNQSALMEIGEVQIKTDGLIRSIKSNDRGEATSENL
jgi:hypothetical protein